MAERITDLHEIMREPAFLRRIGFKTREEDTTGTTRWVVYEKMFQSPDSQLRLVLQVAFEMTIRDDPDASYTDNVSYEFDAVYLRAVDRRTELTEEDTLDQRSSKPRSIGRLKLDLEKVSDLKLLCKMLKTKPPEKHYWPV